LYLHYFASVLVVGATADEAAGTTTEPCVDAGAGVTVAVVPALTGLGTKGLVTAGRGCGTFAIGGVTVVAGGATGSTLGCSTAVTSAETTSSAATGVSSFILQANITTEEITLATILLNILFTLFLFKQRYFMITHHETHTGLAEVLGLEPR
jgi:hypothetical protein